MPDTNEQRDPVKEARELFKNVCRIHTAWIIDRYLMSNAVNRCDPAEKAERHIDLCRFYVAAVRGCSPEDAMSDYEDDFDRQVDMGMREKLTGQEKWIIESWLSGFLAQGVPGILKILMICSDDAVRIDRIVNRDQVTADDAKQNMEERYQKNLAKWARMYSTEWHEWVVGAGKANPDEPIDFWKPDLYDCVIDTYSMNQQQALEVVLNAIKTKQT